jgi:predicted metal-dependent hydrolase
MPLPAGSTVIQGGRPKAYRPIPAADRLRALDEALAAYDRGDFFEAHEILEPAWMGTDDIAERELYQGLIKLSAAFVHAVRGNPLGIEKNLRGASDRLAAVLSLPAPAVPAGIDVRALLAAIDERLEALAARPDDVGLEPPAIVRGTP